MNRLGGGFPYLFCSPQSCIKCGDRVAKTLVLLFFKLKNKMGSIYANELVVWAPNATR